MATNVARLFFPRHGNGRYWLPTAIVLILCALGLAWAWDAQFDQVDGVVLSVSTRDFEVSRKQRSELFVSYRYRVGDKSYTSDQLFTSPFARNWFLRHRLPSAESQALRLKDASAIPVFVSRFSPQYSGLFNGGTTLILFFFALFFSFPLTNALAKYARTYGAKPEKEAMSNG
jgi:Protein of unknown function (DUF3592)